MKKILSIMALIAPLFMMSQQSQASVVFGWDDTFTACVAGCSVSAPGGGVNTISTPVQGYAGISTFDGTFIRSDNKVTISVSGIGAHDTLDIDFLLAIIDSWDGSFTSVAPDTFNVTVDGVTIYSETYDQFDTNDQTASTSNQLSFGTHLGFSGWTDSAYDMGVLSAFTGIAHSASTLTVEFFAGGRGWQGGADESFGLEDISFTAYNRQAVSEPAGVALLGLGIIGLGLARRRMK